MSGTSTVITDERTVAVVNAGYKWSTIFLTYALLADVMYRGLVFHEAAWDLLALVILSGGIHFVYQAYMKALPQSFARKVLPYLLLWGVLAAIIGAVAAFLIERLPLT
ncbi:MAG: hypothetical protein GHCLOJNM_00514 [bacterium]|nr:hypothetical protein [bacterium]